MTMQSTPLQQDSSYWQYTAALTRNAELAFVQGHFKEALALANQCLRRSFSHHQNLDVSPRRAGKNESYAGADHDNNNVVITLQPPVQLMFGDNMLSRTAVLPPLTQLRLHDMSQSRAAIIVSTDRAITVALQAWYEIWNKEQASRKRRHHDSGLQHLRPALQCLATHTVALETLVVFVYFCRVTQHYATALQVAADVVAAVMVQDAFQKVGRNTAADPPPPPPNDAESEDPMSELLRLLFVELLPYSHDSDAVLCVLREKGVCRHGSDGGDSGTSTLGDALSNAPLASTSPATVRSILQLLHEAPWQRHIPHSIMDELHALLQSLRDEPDGNEVPSDTSNALNRVGGVLPWQKVMDTVSERIRRATQWVQTSIKDVNDGNVLPVRLAGTLQRMNNQYPNGTFGGLVVVMIALWMLARQRRAGRRPPARGLALLRHMLRLAVLQPLHEILEAMGLPGRPPPSPEASAVSHQA